MPNTRPNPTLRNLKLREKLRSLRLEQGKRIEDIAESVGLSVSALSRMENGDRKILPRTVRLLAEPLNLTNAQKNELITLAKEAEQHGWWTEYGQAVPKWFDSYVGLEAAADSIRTYENELVHGLLQTPEYARAVYLAAQPHLSEEERERYIELRMARQEVLTSTECPDLWFILNEAVIRRVVGGPAVMRDQLTRILQTAEAPNVRIQVLPYSIGAHAAMDGRFVLLTLPEHTAPDLVYIEYSYGSLYLDRKDDLKRYSWMFEQLRADALAPSTSSSLIRQVMKEFT
ncbi:MAG: helix-turn-helix transcriptional regulator [Nocardiopsaceae bacterium]|nr:helix-turn-helix transcriptional regulator [Nocardiopsaceae bacterium]